MSFRNAVSAITIISLFFVPLLCELPYISAEPIVQSMSYPLENANASFRGVQSDAAGSAVRIVGDVNGDGKADILIGAPGSYGHKNAGQAYLIFGKSTGWSSDISLTNADVIFKAENEGDLAGFSVAAAGDVNGDGLADLLIGAPYNNDNGKVTGKVYLILGRTSGWKPEMDLKSSSASFLGVGEYDTAGFYMDWAGDVNGDGLDEILIYSAGLTDNPQRHAYVVPGRKDGWRSDMVLPKVGTTITGLGYCHFPLSGVGDANGDGMNDLLLLGPERKIFLMLGTRTMGNAGEVPLSTSIASFVLEYSQEQCPALSRAGDVNGDGLNDLLISSPLYLSGSNTSYTDAQGKVYLVFGKKTGWSMDWNLSGADASFVGAPGDILGWAHSGGGDVNGDGLDDMALVAGRIYSGNKDHAGRSETYLVLGNRSGWSRDVEIEKVAQASYLMEENRTKSKSLSASLAGDVNGDGLDDLLIGDPANCEGYGSDQASCPGEAYLVFVSVGKPNNPPTIEPVGPIEVLEGEHFYLRINATDLDRDTLTYSLQGAPSGAYFADNIFEYVPVASDYRPEPYNIKVIVSDGKISSSITFKLTIHFELMTLAAGPVLNSEGAPLEGAQVIMTVNGTPFTNTTGADGFAYFTVPKSLNGTKVDVNIKKPGYTEKSFPANVDKTTGRVGQPGQYPRLSKKTDTKVVSNWLPIGLCILILIVLSIVILVHRNRRKI
jgi:hypothetical protein